jgi:inner membrane protein
MDTITQGLLGAMTAQLGFRQRIGRDATLVAAATALLPDLDILFTPILALTGSEDPGFYMIASHRGITHSLLLFPISALLVAFLWWWFRRSIWEKPKADEQIQSDSEPSFWWLYCCVLVALATHPLLDLFTSYGTQLFLPLTRHRYALDAVPIVDLIYTPILILTLLTCYLVRKFKSNPQKSTLIVGWTGFLLSTVYLFAGLGLHHMAERTALRDYQSQIAAERSDVAETIDINAYPQLGTIFVWRVTAQTPDAWSASKLNFLFSQETLRWNRAEVTRNQWTRQAGELPEVELFKWFTNDQLRADYSREDGLHVVQLFDMRYGRTPESLQSLWSVRAAYNSQTQLWSVSWLEHHRGLTLRQIVAQSWHEIWTP